MFASDLSRGRLTHGTPIANPGLTDAQVLRQLTKREDRHEQDAARIFDDRCWRKSRCMSGGWRQPTAKVPSTRRPGISTAGDHRFASAIVDTSRMILVARQAHGYPVHVEHSVNDGLLRLAVGAADPP